MHTVFTRVIVAPLFKAKKVVKIITSYNKSLSSVFDLHLENRKLSAVHLPKLILIMDSSVLYSY